MVAHLDPNSSSNYLPFDSHPWTVRLLPFLPFLFLALPEHDLPGGGCLRCAAHALPHVRHPGTTQNPSANPSPSSDPNPGPNSNPNPKPAQGETIPNFQPVSVLENLDLGT